MAGRKVFTAGEVLQAADVNDYLMDQSVMVFAGTAARGSAIPSPTEGMVTYLQDSDEVEVYTTSWGAVGGGKILQVVSTAKTDTFTTTSTSFSDVTGLSASITPSSASNKVLIFADVQVASQTGTVSAFLNLVRDSTDIYIGDAAGSRLRTTIASNYNSGGQDFGTRTFLDSPATTSSVTYKLQIAANVAGQLVGVNRSRLDTDSAQLARTASSITLMEVAV